MKNRLDTRLKKLEARISTEPIRVTVMCFGTLPGDEEAALAIKAARRTGVALQFELYDASAPINAGVELGS